MAIPVEDYKQGVAILQHCPEAATMGTLLEADQAFEHRPDNCIDKPINCDWDMATSGPSKYAS